MEKLRRDCDVAVRGYSRETQGSAKKIRGRWLGMVVCVFAMLTSGTFPCGTHAATCEVGSNGYWVMVGEQDHGKCIIPGPPHPLSQWWKRPFRIEGKYKVEAMLSGHGLSNPNVLFIDDECPKCVTDCITGGSEVACPDIYSYDPNGQTCRRPDSMGGKCACHTNGELVTLYEWIWDNPECNNPALTNTPNPDNGKPECPQIPMN